MNHLRRPGWRKQENYAIWKDKMTVLLQLWGVLNRLNSPNGVLNNNKNAEMKLLIIAKMDSVTHNNVVTASNQDSAKLLWLVIKERFTSSQASNRARIFNEFLYLNFKEDAVNNFITNVQVAIKKLELTTNFVCNHLTQFKNEARAELKESSATDASLFEGRQGKQNSKKKNN
ncbi:hypothetical protein VP01_510g18 [Puccinia sorghi]|uniref:Uncharacterized protein n=1 Tax=Puccinia sorghi TaxID=27349 RepID=A0A0L6UL67_9BASI|nr:hypothetical protein VP01_510g18 [Puccinia sorghi]